MRIKKAVKTLLLLVAVFSVSSLFVGAMTDRCGSFDEDCEWGRIVQISGLTGLAVFLYKKVEKKYL